MKLITYEEKKKHFPQLFDLVQIKKECGKYSNIKTYLKKTKNKGIAVFANRNIKKDEIVCYYLVKIYDRSNFENIFDNIYTISIKGSNGETLNHLTGDIFEQSLLSPTIDGIAYWGYLVNEPSVNKKINCACISCDENSIFKTKIEHGDLYRFSILALNNIKKGDEITWNYGDRYNRDNYKK